MPFIETFKININSFFYEGLNFEPLPLDKKWENATDLKAKIEQVFAANKNEKYKLHLGLNDGKDEIEWKDVKTSNQESFNKLNSETLREMQALSLKLVSECPARTIKYVAIGIKKNTNEPTILLIAGRTDEITRQKEKLFDYDKNEKFDKFNITNSSFEKLLAVKQIQKALFLADNDELLKPYVESKLSKWKIVLAVATMGLFAIGAVIYTFVQSIFLQIQINKYHEIANYLDKKYDLIKEGNQIYETEQSERKNPEVHPRIIEIRAELTAIKNNKKEKLAELAKVTQKIVANDGDRLILYNFRNEILEEKKEESVTAEVSDDVDSSKEV